MHQFFVAGASVIRLAYIAALDAYAHNALPHAALGRTRGSLSRSHSPPCNPPTYRVVSLERKSDRSGNAVIRLYQNWRQGVSTTQKPLRPLGTGEGCAYAIPYACTRGALTDGPTLLSSMWTLSADDLDVVDEFAMSERERGSHVRQPALRVPVL